MDTPKRTRSTSDSTSTATATAAATDTTWRAVRRGLVALAATSALTAASCAAYPPRSAHLERIPLVSCKVAKGADPSSTPRHCHVQVVTVAVY